MQIPNCPKDPKRCPKVVSAILQTFRTLDEYSQQLAMGAESQHCQGGTGFGVVAYQMTF